MSKRRSFIAYFSLAGLTSFLSIILAVLNPNKAATQKITDEDTSDLNNKGDRKTPAQKKTEDFKVVGSTSDLDKNGYLQTKEVAVIRSPNNSDLLLAVNPKCTHNGCPVKWSAKDSKYECPCHGASFDDYGNVLNGPATKPLTAYKAKIVGDRVLVKISAPPPKSDRNNPTGRGGNRN
jgi:cytochrome b6-f complex iron-sulfur subunit